VLYVLGALMGCAIEDPSVPRIDDPVDDAAELAVELVPIPPFAPATVGAAAGRAAAVRVRVSGVELGVPASIGAHSTRACLRYQIDGRRPIVASAETAIAFFDMSPGQHTIVVSLAGGDGTRLGPRRMVTVRPEAVQAGAPIEASEPALVPRPASLRVSLVDAEAQARQGAVTIAVELEGVALVDPLEAGFEPQPGRGHLEYRIDGGVAVATTATTLSFHDLPPGTHRVSIRAARSDRSALGSARELLVSIPSAANDAVID
jgi:hypothetical protein